MGTNFYIRKVSNICDCCKRQDEEEIHIGKRSSGWSFLFTNYKISFKEWVEFISLDENKDNIFDEYNEKVSVEEMIDNFNIKGLTLEAYYLKHGNESDRNFKDFEYIDNDGYRIGKNGFC